MGTMEEKPTSCEHKDGFRIDAFARIPGVTRVAPGDAVCATCGTPLPYVLRGNKWVRVEEDNNDA